MTPKRTLKLAFDRQQRYWRGSFDTMASPAEVLIDTSDQTLAAEIATLVAEESWRIEQKFSRYRSDNIVHQINSGKSPVSVDDETAQLLDFADVCYRISDGGFDISSGVLRRVWNFGSGGQMPDKAQIDALLPLIGWHRIHWQKPQLTMPEGMQIDFGGLGKEYAVDQAAALSSHFCVPTLINFGGDIVATLPRVDGSGWEVGIEGLTAASSEIISLMSGAIATSGDTHRYIETDGVRYGHILDPRCGWPVTGAPRTVTVMAETCTQAGMLATFAMLQGSEAEAFLLKQRVDHRVFRP